MSDTYTYEHPFLEGNALENVFKKYEDYYIPIIRKIVNLVDNRDIRKAKETIEGILQYILLFYYRSGAILYEFSDNNDFTKAEVIDSMLDRVGNFAYLDELSKTIIDDYNFLIVESSEGRLALSDQYVSTASLNCKGMIDNLSNRTIGFNNCLILIPLSSRYYAVYYNGRFSLSKPIHNNEIYHLEGNDIEQLNKVIVRNSYQKCIAMHSEELECVKKFKSKILGPVGVIVGHKTGVLRSCTIKKEVFYYDSDEDLFDNYVEYCSHLIGFEKEHKRHIGPNDRCLCGSLKKFKKCCREKYRQAEFIYLMIKTGQTVWMTTKSGFVEKPINEFWGPRDWLSKHARKIVDEVENVKNKKYK